MTAWLISLEGEHNGQRFSLDAPCLVGRGPYNHVVLDDTRISRQHAKISPEAGGHVVYDLNSANGTFVNDVQVKKQKLQPNDLVRFGPFAFRFEEHSASATPPKRFREILTSVGAEPADIVESLDAAGATNPGLPQGLVQLEDADRKLRTLFTFMQSISSTLLLDDLYDRVLANLLDVFPEADTVVIYVPDPETKQLVARKSARRSTRTPRPITFPGQVHDELRRGRAVLSAPTGLSKPRRGLSMHAPILFGNEMHGALYVRGSDDSGVPFSQYDLDLLTGLAAQAGLAMANARFHAESLRQERLRQDLLVAEQIQKSFLPQQLPSVEGIEFRAEYRPAFSVGGDFYDVFWLDDRRIGMFIGDVSGKGVSAALLMARISSDLRLAARDEAQPARVMERVNKIVVERQQLDIFVTAIYATLDIRTLELTLANAGHGVPLLRRAAEDSLQRIEGGASTAIGISDTVEYDQIRLVLEPGETLVLTTDGVHEATSAAGEQLGNDRVERAVRSGSSAPPEILKRVLREVRSHVGEAPQYDDLTVLLCGYQGVAADRMKRRDEPTDAHKVL
jgi:serine phosphatase RsbU (regulator of sigma subunit)